MASLVNIKEVGLMPKWGDSIYPVYLDGHIQFAGQARQAIFADNTHYVFDTDGNTIHSFEAGFSPRAEVPCSTLGGKFTLVSGHNDGAVWQFDPTIAGYTTASWQLIDSNSVPEIGQRIFSWGVTANGWFYIGGGGGNNTVYKTQNFTSWTLVGTLPANIAYVSACAAFEFQNDIYIIGGCTQVSVYVDANSFYNAPVNGYVYKLETSTDTWYLIHQDQERFGQMWLDGAASATHMYIVKGFISTQQFAMYPGITSARQGNNRGIMRSTDGVTWEDLSLYDGNEFLFERHRTGMVNVDGVVYIMAGYAANDFWKIQE